MAQYIDKDALVAEIERRRQELRPTNTHQMKVDEKMDRDVLMWLNALAWVKKLLNTLEVKEVDLGTDFGICWGKYCDCGGNINYYEVAKHFFELGLKVSNHLTWKDIAHINDIISEILKECKDKILYDTQESFCKEVLKRFKVQKGEEV